MYIFHAKIAKKNFRTLRRQIYTLNPGNRIILHPPVYPLTYSDLKGIKTNLNPWITPRHSRENKM